MAKQFNLVGKVILQGPYNIKPLVSSIKRQLGGLNVDVNLKISRNAAQQLKGIDKVVTSLNSNLARVSANALSAEDAIRKLGSAFNVVNTAAKVNNTAINNTAKTLTKTKVAVHQATDELESFGKQAGLAIKRFTAFTVATGTIFGLVSAITNATREAFEFQHEMVKLAQVTDGTLGSVKGLGDEVSRLAVKYGASNKELILAAKTLAQAGFSAEDTKKSLDALAKSTLAPSFDNLGNTTEGLISIFGQFRNEVTGVGVAVKDFDAILGSVNAVSARFAVEADDIVTAIRATGAVFAQASEGIDAPIESLNKLIALFTSVRASTRESAESIGTGLRTIFARIQRRSTIDFLKEFGIQLDDLDGKFVGPFEAVKRLNEALTDLDPKDLRFSAIAEELGGIRQLSKLLPLIREFPTALQALDVAQKGQSSTTEQAVKAQQSLIVQFRQVREEFLKLVKDVINSDVFVGITKGALGFASTLIEVAKAFKGITPFLALIAGAKIASSAGKFLTGFKSAFTQGGGTEALGSTIGSSVTSGTAAKKELQTQKLTVSIDANTLALTKLTSIIQSRPIGKFAKGGIVPGSGSGDTVPAMLEAGEYVVRKKAVQAIGASNLHKMVNGYADGGSVSKGGGHFAVSSDNLGFSPKIVQEILGSTSPNTKVNFVIGPAGSGKSTFTKSKGAQPLLNIADAATASELTFESASGKIDNILGLVAKAKASGGFGVLFDKSPEVVKAQRDKRVADKVAGTHFAFDKRSEAALKATSHAPLAQDPGFISALQGLFPGLIVQKFADGELVRRATERFPASSKIINKISSLPDEKFLSELSSYGLHMDKPSKAERISRGNDIVVGTPTTRNDIRTPSIAGLFLKPEGNDLETIRSSKGETVLKSALARQKATAAGLGPDNTTYYPFHAAYIEPTTAKDFHDDAVSYIRNSVSALNSKYGIGKENKADLDKIIEISNLKGATGSLFEAFVQSFAGKLSKSNAGEGWDISPKDFGENIPKLFGPIPSSVSYADVKLTSSANSYKELKEKALTEIGNPSTSLGFYPANGPITNKDLSSIRSSSVGISPAEAKKFARGGSVDTVPAMLTPGEYVIRKDAAKAIGRSTLDKLNHAEKYAGGGVVTSGRYAYGDIPPSRTGLQRFREKEARRQAKLYGQATVQPPLDDAYELADNFIVPKAVQKSSYQTYQPTNFGNGQDYQFAKEPKTRDLNAKIANEFKHLELTAKQLAFAVADAAKQIKAGIEPQKALTNTTKKVEDGLASIANRKEVARQTIQQNRVKAFDSPQYTEMGLNKQRGTVTYTQRGVGPGITSSRRDVDFEELAKGGVGVGVLDPVADKQKIRNLKKKREAETKRILGFQKIGSTLSSINNFGINPKNLTDEQKQNAILRQNQRIAGASFAATTAGVAIQGFAKNKEQAAVGGALSSGGAGAIAGFQLGGPIGAALGGLGGAALGAKDAFIQFEKTKALDKLAQATENASNALTQFDQGIITATDLNNALAAQDRAKLGVEQSRNVEKAFSLGNLAETTFSAGGLGQQSAKLADSIYSLGGLLGNRGVFQDALKTSTDAIGITKNDTDTQKVLKDVGSTFAKELQGDFAPRASGAETKLKRGETLTEREIAALGSKNESVLAKVNEELSRLASTGQLGKGSNVAEKAQATQDKARELFIKFAREQGVIDQAKKQADQAALANIKILTKQFDLTSEKMGRFSAALDNALVGFEQFSQLNDSLTSQLAGQFSLKARSEVNPFKDIANASTSDLGKAFKSLGGEFGPQVTANQGQILQLKEFQQTFPEFVKSLSNIDQESPEGAIKGFLDKTFGSGNSTVKDLIKGRLQQTLDKRGENGNVELLQNAEDIGKQIASDATKVFVDPLAKLQELRNNAEQAYIGELGKIAAQRSSIEDKITNIDKLRLDIAAREGKTLSSEDIQRPTAEKLARLGAGSKSPSQLVAEIVANRTRFTNIENNRGRTGLGDKGELDALNSLDESINNNVEALNILANSTDKLAAIEDSRSKLEAKREVNRGLAGKVFGGGVRGRLELGQQLQALGRFNAGDNRAFTDRTGQEFNRLVEAIDFAKQQLTGRGNKEGAEALEKNFQKRLEEVLGPGAAGAVKEERNLKDLEASAAKTQLEAAKALKDVAEIGLTRMIGNANKAFETFIDFVKTEAAKTKKAYGGYISGPGGPTADKIPAMLSNGEFVVRASAANRIGMNALNYMNQTGQVPQMVARGGKMTREQYLQGKADRRAAYLSSKRSYAERNPKIERASLTPEAKRRIYEYNLPRAGKIDRRSFSEKSSDLIERNKLRGKGLAFDAFPRRFATGGPVQQFATGGTPATPDFSGFQNSVLSLANAVNKLSEIKIPSLITMQGTHKVEVVINGASVLNDLLNGPLGDMVYTQIQEGIRKHISLGERLEGGNYV